MVKGNICEKCQKNEATTIFDIQGWRKWTVCDACNQELQTCSKCKKNKATNLITDGKGEKVQVCADCCSKPQAVKCDDCQREMKKGEQLFPDKNEKGKQIMICSDCKQKRDNKDSEKCNKCQKGDIEYKITGTNEKGNPEKELNLCKNCKSEEVKKWEHKHPGKGWQGVAVNSMGGNSHGCKHCSYRKKSEFIGKKEVKKVECDKCKGMVEAHPGYPEGLPTVTNQRTKESWKVCDDCYKCQLCKKNPHELITNEQSDKWEAGMWLCHDCYDNKKSPTDKDRKPNPGECCEKCGASSIIHETKTSYTIKRKRYIKHKTDFTREETCWFGLNCSCAREFREANQQTCPQCKKREFPHMKRGWMLDYQINKAFCSPLCHVTYRELKWEEAQRLTQVEMFPPELDVSVNPGENIDWEKEGLKREVLFLRETMRELEASLNNQTNLTPEEQQQSDYLRNLQQNTLRNAESAYQGRYGNLNEDGSTKGMSGGMIFLLVIGGIALVGGIAYFLTRTNKKEKKERW